MITIIGAITAAIVGGLITQFANSKRLDHQRKARRRNFNAVVKAEATRIAASSESLLDGHHRDSAFHASTQFLKAAASYVRAGDVFLSHLAESEVAEAEVVRLLTDGYVMIQSNAESAARLENRPAATPQGIIWAVEDGLRDGVNSLHTAGRLLG